LPKGYLEVLASLTGCLSNTTLQEYVFPLNNHELQA